MSPSELCALLSGATYPYDIPIELADLAKAERLVVVFGASDDLMEFRGAIYDEVGCYMGGTAKVDQNGLLPARDQIDYDEELRDFFAREPFAKVIDAVWCPEDEPYSWAYRTTIPHATFDVAESAPDDGWYCRGIVFSLDHLEQTP